MNDDLQSYYFAFFEYPHFLPTYHSNKKNIDLEESKSKRIQILDLHKLNGSFWCVGSWLLFCIAISFPIILT